MFTFNAPSQPYFYLIADQTPIVPKHIWAALNQSKLHTYTDTHPVGTGPYLMSSCAPQNIKYLNNPNYWQSSPGHPVPAVKEIDYPAFLSNTPANLSLAQGQAQWGGQYIPNIQSFYISKDPTHRHYWFPPVLNVSLFPNLTNPLLSQLPVRQAISYAINRQIVSRLGESGYQAPANQSGVILPTYQAWSDPSLTATTYSTAKADQVLTAAGFTKGSDGIYQDKSGNRLAFTIKTISGFSDWDASLQLITQQLKAAGISVTVQDENTTSYTADLTGRSLPARLRRKRRPGAESRSEPVLRAPRAAVRREHRVDQLRALQVSVDRCAVQSVLGGEPVTAGEHHPRDPEGDGGPDAADPGHRGRRLVSVRHLPLRGLADPVESVRPAFALPGA